MPSGVCSPEMKASGPRLAGVDQDLLNAKPRLTRKVIERSGLKDDRQRFLGIAR